MASVVPNVRSHTISATLPKSTMRRVGVDGQWSTEKETPRPKASWASSEGVRRSMSANRGRDTSPELALRSALHRRGLRFFKHRKPLPGVRCEVDVAFPSARVAVFVDGCFWHGCPEHGTRPATNAEWWNAKLDANLRRDERNRALLSADGWRVVRIWEHESLDSAVSTVLRALRSDRPVPEPPDDRVSGG